MAFDPNKYVECISKLRNFMQMKNVAYIMRNSVPPALFIDSQEERMYLLRLEVGQKRTRM